MNTSILELINDPMFITEPFVTVSNCIDMCKHQILEARILYFILFVMLCYLLYQEYKIRKKDK